MLSSWKMVGWQKIKREKIRVTGRRSPAPAHAHSTHRSHLVSASQWHISVLLADRHFDAIAFSALNTMKRQRPDAPKSRSMNAQVLCIAFGRRLLSTVELAGVSEPEIWAGVRSTAHPGFVVSKIFTTVLVRALINRYPWTHIVKER